MNPSIDDLLKYSVQNNASDLHISTGVAPMVRIDGEMRRMNVDPLTEQQVFALIYSITTDKQQHEFQSNLETDFSFELPDLARFPVTITGVRSPKRVPEAVKKCL